MDNTKEELDDYLQILKSKDPLWEYKSEFGKLLMKEKHNLTQEQLERFDYLEKFIKDNTKK